MTPPGGRGPRRVLADPGAARSTVHRASAATSATRADELAEYLEGGATAPGPRGVVPTGIVPSFWDRAILPGRRDTMREPGKRIGRHRRRWPRRALLLWLVWLVLLAAAILYGVYHRTALG